MADKSKIAGSPATAALLTPRGRGAVATVRLIGDMTLLDRAAPPLFRAANGREVSGQPAGNLVFGHWGAGAGEEVVLCRRDEATLEIHCHGGDAAARRILDDLGALGCRCVSWQEQMEIDSGRFATECFDALSRAPTAPTAEILWNQQSGVLREALEALRALTADVAHEHTTRNVEGLDELKSPIRNPKSEIGPSPPGLPLPLVSTQLTNSAQEACVPSLPPLRGKGWGWGGEHELTPETTPAPDPSPVEGEGRGTSLDMNAPWLRGGDAHGASPRVLDGQTGRTALVARLDELLSWAGFGRHLTQPWRVVVCGRANVGKSSLINALLGYPRSIVYDEPGTTRDVITAETAWQGWPVQLADTAGFRAAEGEIEAAGIARAQKQLAQADGRIVVLDVSRPGDAEDLRLLSDWPDALVVAHKCDLPDLWQGSLPPRALRVSSLTGEGVAALGEQVAVRLVPRVPLAETAVPICDRQIDLLTLAREAALAGEFARVGCLLDELLG
ncbi:MAG: GTPase [Planctomycetaceae bacterium]